MITRWERGEMPVTRRVLKKNPCALAGRGAGAVRGHAGGKRARGRTVACNWPTVPASCCTAETTCSVPLVVWKPSMRWRLSAANLAAMIFENSVRCVCA